jgi:glutamate-1-semialdehyde 2,1-aminomutase
MLVRAGSGLAGDVAASSEGVPAGILGDTLVAPLDDEAALRSVFEQDGRTIAAAIVEPLPANFGLLPQREEWLRTLASLCRDHGTLLILDEVISGFRVGRGGMAEALEIVPDLVCYGKVMGGGFPAAAYAGRADLMSLVAPDGPVYQAGTLSANPVATRAGLATLAKMEAANGWQVLAESSASFARQLADDLSACGAAVDVVHTASIFWLRRAAAGVVRSVAAIPQGQAEWYRRLFHAALARGVYLPPAGFEVCFVSLAHDRATLDAARMALIDAAREAH